MCGNSGRENGKYMALNFRNFVVILLGIHQGGESPIVITSSKQAR